MLAAGRHIVCFALLIAMAGHSWSQEPSPSPGETTNQNQTPRNENQTKSDTDQHGTEQSPYFIKIIGAEPNATDWWMFWATVAATQHFGRFRSEARTLTEPRSQNRIYEYTAFCNGPGDVKSPE